MIVEKEWIEDFRRMFVGRPDEQEVNDLCTLALERLAMEPRPIAEAPKDGTRFLSLGPSKDYPGTRYAWPCRWTDFGWTTVSRFLENEPDSFIPLSSLPKVPT